MRNKFLEILALTLFSVPLSAIATPILIDGIEWQQPIETVGLSYNDVASVCDTESGTCSGVFGEIDLTGWTWASATEVGNLFSALTPHPGGVFNYFENQSAWAPSLVELFVPTWETISIRQVMGLTRTTYAGRRSTLATGGEIRDWYGDYNHNADGAFSDTGFRLDTRYSNVGHWLYRAQVATVPEPGTLGLLALATIGMGVARRRN